MKEKIINILKLIFSVGLFLYISSFIGIILSWFNIDINNLSLVNKTLLNFFVSVFMCFVVTVLYYKDLLNYFKEFKYNWKSKVLFTLKLFGIFMLLKLLSSYISVVLSGIFNIEQLTSENQSTINDLLGQFPLLMTMSAVVLAPYYEEILFRLAFKRSLNNKLIFIVISGFIFGLIHIFPTNLNLGVALIQSIPYITMGLCLAYYYSKYNNIFYSILIHFYNNLFSVIILLLSFLIK